MKRSGGAAIGYIKKGVECIIETGIGGRISMPKKNKKHQILVIIQKEFPYDYKTIKEIYDITGSYDAIPKMCQLAMEYNIDVIKITQFLYINKENT